MNSHHIRALVAFVAVCAGVALAWQWLNQPTDQPIALPTHVQSASVSTVVMVDVAGGVKSPGVVEVPAGSRVQDAIKAAGGLKRGVVPGVNLARVVVDGEQIFVGQQVAGSSAGGKVNINRATAAELESLPGVGPVLAGRIVEYRNEHGSFQSWKDVDGVSGVGPSMLDKLRDVATIG
jgi:competence protein ComEA